MILADYHTHTTFSDGRRSPEEMVLAAIARGFSAIGISDHSHTAFDDDYCLGRGRLAEYRSTVNALKEKYRARIRVCLGIEQDFYSEEKPEGLDYVIGSVHYVRVGREGDPSEPLEYISVDKSPACLKSAVERRFGGDFYAFAEAYFENVSQVVERTECDLIGHFDLIAKFNRGNAFFDESDPRYLRAWQAAADRLLLTGKAFEVNTGAIFRGYRDVPYPAPPMRAYLAERGARFVLSGDAHRSSALGFRFEEWQ